MSDPLVSQIEAVISPTPTQTPREVGQADVERSIASWLGSEPDSDVAKFIAEQVKGKTVIEALQELKDYERRIGPPKFGEDRVQRLHDYMKLLSQSKNLRLQLETFER
jgi:hypothetical protein